MARLTLKEYEEAERCFLQAVELNPAVKFYYNNLAVACMNQRKYLRAYGYLKIALSLDPSYVKALSNMAVTCFHLYRFREAYGFYQRAQKTDPAYSSTRFEINRVIRRVEELQKEDPKNRDIQRILLLLKEKQGRD